MKSLKITLWYLGSFLLLHTSCQFSPEADQSYRLWYEQPARFFEEALVLGNGKMGATVFGGTSVDSIYLNDATLWSGEPVDPHMNPDAHLHIPALREALAREDYPVADSLNRFIQGTFSQSYAPLGTLYLKFPDEHEAVDYVRELDISKATGRVSYLGEGARYTRTYAVSHPDQVMLISLESDQAGALDFKVGFSSLLRFTASASDSLLNIEGYAPYHVEPNYRGDIPDPVRFDADRGTRFSTLIRVSDTDGEVSTLDGQLQVSGATRALLIISAATSFNGFDKDPAREGKDQRLLAHQQLKAAAMPAKELLQRHQSDYKSFFERLSLHLGPKDSEDLPTDQRLRRYAKGYTDPYLEELYFQFGRYLLISSSRTPEVPANLQGIWNPYLRPPWSSNYTVNINVEENYWLAEPANLSEMHRPLLGFISNLAETGKVSAQTFYGVKRGWCVAHNSDIWAMSNPVGDFGKGHPVWANWNMGGAWLATHLWEHYQFTQDLDFLENTAFPLMKGASEFCLDWMVEDREGKLITSPSTSPENSFLLENGYHGATFYGGSSDLAMIRELFLQTLAAVKVLEISDGFTAELEAALERLHPYRVGKLGQLLEWYHDWDDVSPLHRHQSHLYGLHPGHHIRPEESPELAKACRTTLEIKGDKSTGWSQGWRINLWARLLDGDRAYGMYRQLLRFVDPSGLETNYSNSGGTYPNLLDAHPPFQIDGNFGGAAGVLEMLVQSSSGEIVLLPALPAAWPDGRLSGTRARGGFEVSMEWEDMKLVKCSLASETGGTTSLVYGDLRKEVKLRPGETRSIRW